MKDELTTHTRIRLYDYRQKSTHAWTIS